MASVQNVKINCLDRKPNVYVIVNNLITQKFRKGQKKTLKADREHLIKPRYIKDDNSCSIATPLQKEVRLAMAGDLEIKF